MGNAVNHRSEHLLNATQCGVLIIDLQEKFFPVIPDMKKVVDRSQILLKAASAMQIPVWVTEQYPKGLGHTADSLMQIMPPSASIHAKSTFSALGEGEMWNQIRDSKVRQLVVAGVESHVCVLQTVFDLLAMFDGWVFVVADAVASRKEHDKHVALERMARAGAHIITTEMAVFEWVGKAGTPLFKEAQSWVK